MTGWHLAQLNLARIRYEIDDPRMAGFVDNLDRINRLGEESQGFVWRYQDESGAAIDTRPFEGEDDLLINLTVWESVDDLRAYVLDSDHVTFLRRRLEWFERVEELPGVTLWWIPAGTLPSIDEAIERCHRLRDHGPSERAFTFKDRFGPPAVSSRE